MVVIRLSRGGTNKRPFYHLVVADSRRSRDGRFIEQIGYFNPIAKGGEKRLEIDTNRVNYWINKGAKPSETVAHLLFILQNPERAAQRKVKADSKKATRNAKKKALAKAPKAEGAAATPAAAPAEAAAAKETK